MWFMDYDWERLGNAVRDARAALDLSQEELAKRAGVSKGAVKKLESKKGYATWPTTVGQIERALDWEPGHARKIAQAPPLAAAGPSIRGSILPAAVQVALREGELLGADVVEIQLPGSKMRVIVVGTLDDYTEESLRAVTQEWLRINTGIRKLVSKPDETAAPADT